MQSRCLRKLARSSAVAAITTAASSLGLSAGFAADLPVKARAFAPSTYDWSGFYAGANVGYGFGRAPTDVGPNSTERLLTDPESTPAPSGSRLNGVVGGGQIGYNLQLGNIVAGLETDLSYAGLRRSGTAAGPFFIGGTLATTVETKLDWFGTFRGRLGFLPTDGLLLYGTGGLAYGGVKTTVTTTNLAAPCGLAFIYCTNASTGGTSIGWAAGAGAEYALTPAWTVKAEYLHIDLGDRTAVGNDPATPGGAVLSTTGFRMDTVRVGVNYRFGAP